MLKPSKQNKPDHSRSFTEGSSSEANASIDHAVSHKSSLPESSQEALHKHIAKVVEEKGRCTQKVLNDSFA